MTTSFCLDDIRADEGCRLRAYPDPATGGAPWTIGYGHTGKNVFPDLTWTQGQAEAALVLDAAHAENAVSGMFPWFHELNDARQDVLVNMTFNMGLGNLIGFIHALAAMKHGDWQEAHDELLASKWARYGPTGVRRRAHRLAEQVLTGERIDPKTFQWTPEETHHE